MICRYPSETFMLKCGTSFNKARTICACLKYYYTPSTTCVLMLVITLDILTGLCNTGQAQFAASRTKVGEVSPVMITPITGLPNFWLN